MQSDLVRDVRRILLSHTEVIALVLLVLSTFAMPNAVPNGIRALGFVTGASLALQATGVVLIYRANRIINFAQFATGAVAATLLVYLVHRHTLLLGLSKICPACVDTTTVDPTGQRAYQVPVNVSGWLLQAEFWISVVLALALGTALAWASYMLVVRRFANAPRLVGTVVTLGLVGVCDAISAQLERFWGYQGGTGAAPFPFSFGMTFDGAVFGSTAFVTLFVAAAALVSLAIFFRRSPIGVVLRGASDNPDRATTLGVNVGGVTSVVWLMAGALSSIAGVLVATSTGKAVDNGSGILLRLLVAAVIARMTSIPLAVAAALVIGVFDQSVLWAYQSAPLADASLLVMAVIILLLQRVRSARSDTDHNVGWSATAELRPIPRELRNLTVVRAWVRTLTVMGALIVLGLPWVLSNAQANLAAVTVIYGIIGMSLLVLTGWAGQISLGQFGFAAVGAYVTAVVHLPFPIPLILGGLAGAATALVVGLPALRLRGLQLAITTLAFAVAAQGILLSPRYLGSHLPKELGRPVLLGVKLDDQRLFFYFVLAFLGLVTIAVLGMRSSRTARALIACRDNEAAAQAFGINLLRARLGAFVVSGFIAAVAGGLFAYSQYGVQAPAFEVGQSLRMFEMAIIGGLGSVAGPLIGAVYLGVIDIAHFGRVISFLATGGGVVALLLFAPGGLAAVAVGVRDSMLRRVAERYRIEVPSLLADRRVADHRAPVAEKARTGGGKIFVPVRYRLPGQWEIESRREAAVRD